MPILNKYLTHTGDLTYQRRLKTIVDMLDLQDTDDLLDLGCGEGFLLDILKELSNAKLEGFDKWDGDIEKGLPYPNDTFDKVVCSEVMEHLKNDWFTFDEIWRILKPGGILVITVPNENYPFLFDPINGVLRKIGWGHTRYGIWSKDHYRLYNTNEILRRVRFSNYRIKEIKYLTHYCVPFYYYILRLGKVSFAKRVDKFQWDAPLPWYFSLPMRLFLWVDKRNENYQGKGSVHIAVKLEKKNV